MRHIPEDELHAYLDQALSRSQCIEIETHLARCPPCRDARDEAAALRDRTTALLARVTPGRVTPPSYAALMVKAEARHRGTWRRPALWAASFVGAVLVGWGLRATLDPHSPAPSNIPQTLAGIEAEAPASPPAVGEPRPSVAEIESRHTATPVPLPGVSQEIRGPAPGESEVRLAAERQPAAPPGPAPPEATVAPALALDAAWASASLSEAEEATGGLIPLIPDLPVVGVQLRPAGAQERPLVLVTQRHGSGTLVYTVEGPVRAVAEVVASQLGPSLRLSSSEPSRSPPDYVEEGPAFQRTSRVLAVMGSLPVDTLNLLAQGVVLR